MSPHLIPIRLYQILEEHSDQEHPLSMGELRRLLRVENGVSCDRRTIYGALDSLRYAGCDIPNFQDSRDGYFLLSRKLEPAEVRLLLDCAAAFSSRLSCPLTRRRRGRRWWPHRSWSLRRSSSVPPR